MHDDEARIVSASRVIAADPATIFELIADPARQPEWDGNDNLAEAAPGQRVRHVGDTFTMMLTLGTTRENHVVELLEGRVIAWKPAEPGHQPPGHVWRWELDPVGDGETFVVHTYDWTALTDPARSSGLARRPPNACACRSIDSPRWSRAVTERASGVAPTNPDVAERGPTNPSDGHQGVWPKMAAMATARRGDMFTADGKPSDDDPRENGPTLGDERTTLVEAMRCQRLTLEMKCAGLDAEAMARRAVEPSTMSLLGLVRHLADGERQTFRVLMAGQDVPRLFCSDADRDGDFDGAVADPDVVAEAWDSWRAEVDFATQFLAGAPSLDITGEDPANEHGSGGGSLSLREVLVGLIEEYARHMGHADLLRERIDGRIGQ